MSATLDKSSLITFSICLPQNKSEIDVLAGLVAEEKSEQESEDIKIVEKEIKKAIKSICKKLDLVEESKFQLKRLMVIVLLTQIFKEHFDKKTDPVKSVDYILSSMDTIWAEIKRGG